MRKQQGRTNHFIITENINRIDIIDYLEPIGDLSKAHSLLKIIYNLENKKNESDLADLRRINYRKANYDQMKIELLKIDWLNLFEGKSVNEMYDYFLDHYNHLCESYIPKIKKKYS